MKKIYLSFTFFTLLILGSSAQNNRHSNLSEDEKASLGLPVNSLDLSAIQLHKQNVPQVLSPLGCDTMGTRFAGGNSHNGNMFDLVNTSSVSVQIIGFDQCFAAAQTDSFEVWYKSGSFIGFESNSSAWTFVGRCNMSPAAANVPYNVPISLTVTIPPSATYGFYLTNITAGFSNAYTNGTTLSNVLKTKDGLQFLEGKGGGYPFAVTFSPRIWNGVIHYCTPLVTGISSLTTNETVSEVYPNPMANEATITISNAVKVNNAILKVYDMAGRIVYSMNTINANSFELRHNLNSGLYIVQVENENSIILNKKISVQ
jgi:hypothetical protein